MSSSAEAAKFVSAAVAVVKLALTRSQGKSFREAVERGARVRATSAPLPSRKPLVLDVLKVHRISFTIVGPRGTRQIGLTLSYQARQAYRSDQAT